MRKICVLILLLLSALRASADDQPLFLKDDARLQIKVTLKLYCEPLSLFADTVKKATGVKLYVRKDIADQNVTVFAEDIPAYDVMNQAALLFDYNWSMKGDPPNCSYTFHRSLKQKAKADELREGDLSKKDAQFKQDIEDGVNLIDSDPAKIQEAFNKNPAQVAEYIIFKDTLKELACFSKQERDAIWERIAGAPYNEIKIPFAELPKSLQKMLRESWDENAAKGHGPDSSQIDQQYLIISRGGGHGSPYVDGMPPASVITFFGMTRPDGSTCGSAGLGSVPPGSLLDDWELRYLQEVGIDTSSCKPSSQECVEPESKTKRINIKFEEVLEKEKGKDSNKGHHTFAEVLEAASRMFKVSIFADDYLSRIKNHYCRRGTFPDDPDEAMAELGREFKYGVTKVGNEFRLRNETWFLDETKEVPKRLVLRWDWIKKDQESLELKDYIEIAGALNNMQIKGLGNAFLDSDRPLLWEAMRMSRCLDHLRFCAKLSVSQLKTACESQLPYDVMTPPQQEAFARKLHNIKSDLSDDMLSQCAFKVRREEKLETDNADETDEPITTKEDNQVFTYILGPANEKRYELMLGFKRVEKTKNITTPK